MPTGADHTDGQVILAAHQNALRVDIAAAQATADAAQPKTSPHLWPDGTVAAPGTGPTTETSSGWYRVSAGILGLAILGVQRLKLSATELLVSNSVTIQGPRPWVDLKAYCVLDGTTDDSAAFATAAAAAGAGGTILLPATTTMAIASLVTITQSNVTLAGMGVGSVIKLNSATAGIVATSTTNFTLRDLKIMSTRSDSSSLGSLYAQAAVGTRILNVRFEGGKHQINLNTCTYFRIEGTTHTGPTTAGGFNAYIVSSSFGQLISPVVEAYTAVASGSQVGCINVQSSDHIAVSNVTINAVDLSTVVSGFGFGFTTSTNCSLYGGTISNMKGADGILVQTTSTDIVVDSVNSSNNNVSAGSGANTSTGDGIDIFNSQRVRVSNSIFRGNGAVGNHPQIEIYTCNDVQIDNCEASDGPTGSDTGIKIVGTPDVSIINCTARRNRVAGLSAISFGGNECTNLKIIGGDFTDNNLSGSVVAGQMEGIYLANATTFQISNVRAVDTRAGGARTQQYGIRMENTARGIVSNCKTDNNVVAGDGIQDTVVNSVITGTDNLNGQWLMSKGTAALPGTTFRGDTDTGMYWISANTLGFATGGSIRGQFDSNGLTVTGNLYGVGTLYPGNGAVGSPSYSFINSANAGMYLIAANDVALSANSTKMIEWTGTNLGFYGVATVARAAAIGAPTAPSAGYVQAEAQSMKTAVDAIRVALTNLGLTS